MSTEDRATRKNRRNQLVGFAAWIGAGGGPAPSPGPAIDAELAGPDTAEETWIRRSESRMGGIESRLREMEGDNRRLAADNEKLRTQLRAGAEDARSVIDRQAAIIEEMTRRSGNTRGGNVAAAGRLLPGTRRAAARRRFRQGPGPGDRAGAADRAFRSRRAAGRRIRAGREAARALASGRVPCRGGGGVRCRRLGRHLLPERSASGAAAPDRPGMNRG